LYFRGKNHTIQNIQNMLPQNIVNTEKYQPARQNMKFVTRSVRSLANKLHILARQADIFGINQFTYR
jgi:hypothetical protein